MSDQTPSRLGAANNATGTWAEDNALFLKVFAGLVLTTYQEANKMDALHMVRHITSGKQAQFPVIGTATASYHTPGAEIDGQTIKANERTINVDDLLIAPVFIAQIDELKNHYEVRAEYATQLGRALAVKKDKQLLQLMCLAARASATITGGNGGSQITDATFDTDASAIAAGLFEAAETLDEKDVPEDDRYAVFRPEQYYLLAQNTTVINRDWGGSGAYKDGTVFRIAGINIVKSNHLPSADLSAETGAQNTYHGDFTNTFGVVFHKSAIGSVNLLDLKLESEYQIYRQGTLMVAKMAVGHGILRPECAVELITA